MDSSPPTASAPPSPPAPGQRSLAAIVFTDVVNFSARMQEDEETTLRLLKRDFEVMRAICVQHHGSVLKSTGDGLLLYFSSAVQAVASALSMQRFFAEHGKTRPPVECLAHRVGIHLGDVFVNEQDVMGDGVNIAARLQEEAEPGGICISQTVYDVVRNKLALHVTRLSPRELKNISQAIPIYRLLLEAQTMDGPPPDPETEWETRPPAEEPLVSRTRRRQLALVGAAVLVLGALAVFFLREVWHHRRQLRDREEVRRREFADLMVPEETVQRMNRTLADWRGEIRDQRSRALEEYDFAELEQMLRDPKSPVAGKPEARIRAQALQRIQVMRAWLAEALQRYDRQNPLVIHELTGTAPKEIRVFVGRDQRLYYAEGRAIRQRPWNDLRPSVLAAIVAGAMLNADPFPPRDAVQGAFAFAGLYNLPELPATLRLGRLTSRTP